MKGHNMPKIIGKKSGNKFIGENYVVKRQSTQSGESALKPELNIESQKIDLFKVSVKNLEQKIQRNLNSGNPSDFLFLWSGERKLKKEQMDVEHQNIIISQIQSLRAMGLGIAELQADRVFNGGLLKCILEKRKADADFVLAQQKNELHALASDMIDRSLQHQVAQAQIKEMNNRIQNEKILTKANARAIEAEAKIKEAEANKQEMLTNGLKYINENKLKDFPPGVDAIMIALAMGRSAEDIVKMKEFEAFKDLLNQERKEDLKQKKTESKLREQDVELRKQEVREKKSQVDISQATSQRTVNGINEILKK